MKNCYVYFLGLVGLWLLGSAAAQAQNLALNKPVAASSAQQPAANAVDGNGSTHWESAFSDLQDITVDLGAEQYVDRIRLTWENAYGKDFTLQVSGDQFTWTTVATATNNAATVNEYSELGAANVRYVKLTGTARATPYGYSLYEFEVFNYSNSFASNRALGKKGVASSVEGSAVADRAFDGNASTRWGSPPKDGQWVYVNLGRRVSISQVNLVWETAHDQNFRIDVSDNATNWTTLATVTNNTLRTNELTGLSGTGQYVRMYGVTRGTGCGFSLGEFQVYGRYVAPPVELTTFQAAAETATAGAATALTWTTASERDNLGFEVQRSADGRTFMGLAWVEGAGASQLAHTYGYRDAAPLRAGGYYRLVQYDADGKVTYSPVQAVRRVVPAALSAFPNPAIDQVTVAWPTTGPKATQWCVTNALGHLVHTQASDSLSTLTLDLRPYAAGTYYLTVLADELVLGRTKVQKLQ